MKDRDRRLSQKTESQPAWSKKHSGIKKRDPALKKKKKEKKLVGGENQLPKVDLTHTNAHTHTHTHSQHTYKDIQSNN